MDLSAIIVVITLSILAFGAIVGLEFHSRKTRRKEAPEDELEAKRNNHQIGLKDR